jgi:hypothetical protein
MKSLVLVCALYSVFAIATNDESGVSRRLAQVHELLRSKRQLQDNCEKDSAALRSAFESLYGQAAGAFGKCLDTPFCSVNYRRLKSYNRYKKACSRAKGAFSTYKVTISCDDAAVVAISLPRCLISKNINENCDPKQFEEASHNDGCTETVTNTGCTDYSGTKPVKKPAKRPRRRRTWVV